MTSLYSECTLCSKITAAQVQRDQALKELENLRESVRKEAEEVVVRLNSNKDQLDEVHKILHTLNLRGADFEVIQQYKALIKTVTEELKKTQIFFPCEKLLAVRG